MNHTEELMAAWFTGVRPPSLPGRTVVVDSGRWLDILVATGVLDDSSALLHRAPAAAAPAVPYHGEAFVGGLDVDSGDLVFDSGLRIAQCQYGLADFLCIDGPVALRVTDEHDFSAFLRDADLARTEGRFARCVTDPLAMIADVAGLGALATTSGPRHRIFVARDGAISTSPTGRRLGTVGESWSAIQRRWAQLNEQSVRPCVVCLAGVVAESDRADALVERPWMTRYLDVLGVLKAIRGEHLEPRRVSGFGGRLTPGLPWSAQVDDRRAPVLVRVGDVVRAVDPTNRRWLVLSTARTAVAEAVLGHGRLGSAADWIDRTSDPAGHGRGAATTGAAAIASLLELLDRAGVATGWVAAVQSPEPECGARAGGDDRS